MLHKLTRHKAPAVEPMFKVGLNPVVAQAIDFSP